MLGIEECTVNSRWEEVKSRFQFPDRIRLAHFCLARGWIKNIYANEPNG